MTSAAGLPQYERPPLVEVALGVQYAELRDLRQAHVGLLWAQHLRAEFPETQDRPRLDPIPDPTLRPTGARSFRVDFHTVSPMQLVWFINRSRGRLIQLQPDRMVMNWRGEAEGGRAYPRFDALSQEYRGWWHVLQEFLSTEDVGEPRPQIVELLYANRIAGRGLVEVLPVLSTDTLPLTEVGPPTPRMVLTYPVLDGEEPVGRLRVEASQEEQADGEPTTRVDLNVRVSTGGRSDWAALEHLFALGRKIIVTAFDSLTSDEMHDEWGRSVRK